MTTAHAARCRIAALNRENGALCMRLLRARNLALNALQSKTLADKNVALYKIVVELGYKDIARDLKSEGIKRPW
jgi:hypothetical protein